MDELKIMTLYHATTSSRGIQIINDGKISCQAAPVFVWAQPTTPGWIYLSDHVDSAVHWGNKVSLLNKEEDFFYIFKVSIPLSACFTDEDDLEYNEDIPPSVAKNIDVLTCLELCHSCRVNRDLPLGYTVVSYCKLPVDNNKNREHPLACVVSELKSYISPHDYIRYEKYRGMIIWSPLSNT